MLDSVQIEAARESGVLFVCFMCKNWHKGVDCGVENRHGEGACVSKSCKSVLGGGAFEDYDGPLAGYLVNFCHVFGKENPEHALESNVANTRRIGCCAQCLKKLQGMTVEPDRGPGKRVIWTTEGIVGPEKFEVVK